MYTCPFGKANGKSGQLHSVMCFGEGHLDNVSNYICNDCQQIEAQKSLKVSAQKPLVPVKVSATKPVVSASLDMSAVLKKINTSMAGRSCRLIDTSSTSAR